MSHLIPDYVFSSIYDITPALLAKHGVRGVLIDLDGTMASHRAALPPDTVAPFICGLRDAGVQVLVFSNNNAHRVGTFCEALGVPFVSSARKPFRKAFDRAAEQLGLKMDEIAVVGDQIFTDVFGGNRAGALTCYVQTLDRHFFWINARYQLERYFIGRGQKQMEARSHHDKT